MKRNYRFTDYYTLASVNNQFPSPNVCFADITNRGRIYNSIYLYIAKDHNFGFGKNIRHNLTLTFDELKKLIKLTKNICKFKHRIALITHKNEEYYKIHLKFDNINNTKSILFVLTALRYSYEFPFNVICKDSLKLIKNPRFKNRGFFNICNFIFRIFFSKSERTVHSLCDYRVSNTKKSELITRVKKIDKVHSLFNYDKGVHLKELDIFDEVKYNQDFWDNNFNDRYNIYINNINNFNKK